jgi:hypothetical protein
MMSYNIEPPSSNINITTDNTNATYKKKTKGAKIIDTLLPLNLFLYFQDSFDSYDDSEEMLIGATNNLVNNLLKKLFLNYILFIDPWPIV